MPAQYGSTDPTLMMFTSAVNDLFQQFQQTHPSEWGELLQKVDDIREGIEQKIDAWMTLDEQIDEMIEAAVLEDIDAEAVPVYPSIAAANEMTPPNQSRTSTDQPAASNDLTETDAHTLGSLRKAIGFYDLLLFEEASSLFSQVLQTQPNNLVALLFYAAAETVQGRFQGVLPQLEQVFESNETRFRAAANEIRAAGYFKQGKINEAVDSLLHIVTLQPDNQDAWFNLGFCYIKLEDWSAAAGALSQVLDVNQDDARAQELLVDVWNQLGEYDAALKLSEDALTRIPGHSGFLLRKARSLRLMGNLSKSIQLYQQVLLQIPRQGSAYDEYATVCIEAGDLGTAAAVLQKSLSLVPGHTRHKEKLVVVLLLQHRADEAYKILQSLNHSTEASFIHTIALAQYEWQKGGKKKAVTLLEGVIHQSENDFRRLAIHYYKQLLDELEQSGQSKERIHKLNIT